MGKHPKRAGWGGTFVLLSLFAFAACASMPAVPAVDPESQGADRPSLVVFIVIDQLRGDLLDRYSSLFTGGLKRLMDEGLSFSNALHDHAQTETSPGHAALSTGVFPGRAGIPSNAWREGEGDDLHPVYNVVDPEEGILGVSGIPGASPGVLLRTGLADWILEARPDASVVSVSGKDRAAVLMAGKSRGEVYWYDAGVGRFVTSTYYRSWRPTWLKNYNDKVLKKYVADSVWHSMIPPESVHLSAPDTADFEGDGVHTYFPHRFHDEVSDPDPEDFFFWLETTPMLDRATLEVALRAMEEERLGMQRGRTDFLSISFSQTDRVGHAYGPLSREQMDNLLRLDQVMGDLLDALDEQVGAGNYLLGFTGDHGVMNNPERIEGGGLRLTLEHKSELERVLSAAARVAGQRRDLSTARAMVDAMKDLPFVGPTFSHEELQRGTARDSLATLFQHSFFPGRAGGLLSTYGVEMWWAENTLSWGMPKGTTHGSPFYYDRWVPLILMGPGVDAGVEERPVRALDLAPTLAGLAGIPYPDDLDGKPLIPVEAQTSTVR